MPFFSKMNYNISKDVKKLLPIRHEETKGLGPYEAKAKECNEMEKNHPYQMRLSMQVK